MDTRTPAEIFMSQYEAFLRGDLDTFLEHWAEDCTFRDMTEPAPRKGHAPLYEYMSAYARDMTEIETTVDTLFCTDTQALAEISITGTWRGEGAAPEGTRVTLNYCVVDHVRDRLVQTETVYWNPQQLAEQLPAPAALAAS
jgi:steroid delta-isomerase-like uncharacterized protein